MMLKVIVILAVCSLAVTEGLMLGINDLGKEFLPLAQAPLRCLLTPLEARADCPASKNTTGGFVNSYYFSMEYLWCLHMGEFNGHCNTTNRFDSFEACRDTCMTGVECPENCQMVFDTSRRGRQRCQCPKDTSRQICGLPKDPGFSHIPGLHVDRYYYNSEAKTCQSFTFARGGGNANNFGSILKCKDVCMYESTPRTHLFRSANLILILSVLVLVCVIFYYRDEELIVDLRNDFSKLRSSHEKCL